MTCWVMNVQYPNLSQLISWNQIQLFTGFIKSLSSSTVTIAPHIVPKGFLSM